MERIRKVAVIMPARNERKSFSEPDSLPAKILRVVPEQYDPTVHVVVSNADSEFTHLLAGVENDRVKVTDLCRDPGGLAKGYLTGFKLAIDEGADCVVEMDANGSHDPQYLPKMIKTLEDSDAAFSSRFSSGGGINKYPLSRRLVSLTGTAIANLLLVPGKWVPDMTGGFEAFRSETLKDILGAHPIDEWISVTRGPGHFFQTEMRTLIIWRKHRYSIVPIVWGTNRTEEAKALPLKTLYKAFGSALILRASKTELVRK